MIRISNVAGFVCDYQPSELYPKYFMALAIALCVIVLGYLVGVRRIQTAWLRTIALTILMIAALLGAQYAYMTMIGGNWFGCGLAPWAAHPNPN